MATGDKPAKSRGRFRSQRAPKTAAAVGALLLAARLDSGTTLLDIQARTGIDIQDLEAIEGADFAHFHAVEVATVVVSRYAHVLELDVNQLVKVLHNTWPVLHHPSVANVQPQTGSDSWGVGQLTQYPEDQERLWAFTQTSQIPAVHGPGDASSDQVFDHTSSFELSGIQGSENLGPSTYSDSWIERRRTPLILRVAVWTSVFLLLLASAGLGVNHWKPSWVQGLRLNHLHISNTQKPTKHVGTIATPTVSAKTTGANSSSVTIQANDFSVLVTTSGDCWVQATVPSNFNPVFSGILSAGSSKSIPSSDGLLTVQFGSSHADVVVEVNGKTVAGWSFSPTDVPYVLTFATAKAAGLNS